VLQRELVIAFFAYNAAQMVVSFHFFVDMVTDAGGHPAAVLMPQTYQVVKTLLHSI
jgi:hypothetical protein